MRCAPEARGCYCAGRRDEGWASRLRECEGEEVLLGSGMEDWQLLRGRSEGAMEILLCCCCC